MGPHYIPKHMWSAYAPHMRRTCIIGRVQLVDGGADDVEGLHQGALQPHLVCQHEQRILGQCGHEGRDGGVRVQGLQGDGGAGEGLGGGVEGARAGAQDGGQGEQVFAGL